MAKEAPPTPDANAEPKVEKKILDDLVEKAKKASKKAYCPYSKFNVGSVVVDVSGKEWQGANIENAAYGSTICAERTAITSAVFGGLKKIKYIICIADSPTPCTPCGACRQVIAEFSDKDTIIIAANMAGATKKYTMAQCLPDYFNRESLGIVWVTNEKFKL